MQSHLDFELVSQRMAQTRRDVERNRLGSRLAEARSSNDALLPEGLNPRRRGMVARGIAVVMALFR